MCMEETRFENTKEGKGDGKRQYYEELSLLFPSSLPSVVVAHRNAQIVQRPSRLHTNTVMLAPGQGEKNVHTVTLSDNLFVGRIHGQIPQCPCRLRLKLGDRLPAARENDREAT